MTSGAQGTPTTPLYVTKNDSNDADTGGNNLLNFPVFKRAILSGSTLVVSGYARPGSTIELFIAAPDPSGFGEGQSYLFTGKEGSALDTDAGTGSYISTPGTDTTNQFQFAVPLPAGVVVGTPLTATATCLASDCTGTTVVSNSTSEFSYNILVEAAPVVTLLKLGRNVSTLGTFSNVKVDAAPTQILEYCIVYSNAGGVAANFVLSDNVPVGVVIVPDAYASTKGIRWAGGTVVAVGGSAAPAGLDLTNASDVDQGTLTSTGGTNLTGVMTLNLGAGGLAAGGKGTVCFQTRVP